jgi:hypothetical protein
MTKKVNKCNCLLLDDDLLDGGSTCYHCHEKEKDKGITPNQLNYTLKELQVCYDTEQLKDLFIELLDDGYLGLSLGLVIDVIKQRLETLDKPESKKEIKSYEGYLTLPFRVEGVSPDQYIDTVINTAVDKLGALDLGQLTWDNPEWTVRELTDNE